MKVRIKTYNGELPDYLTLGKEYNAFPSDNKRGATITNDFGDETYINIDYSCHLNDGSWEIVE